MTEPLFKPIDMSLKDADDWGLPKEGAHIYINSSRLPDLVAEYVRLIEAERTNRICKCEWIVHPDDENKPEGQRRVRKGEAALDCPVHTKEGFLIGFFRWIIAGERFVPAIDVSGYDQPPNHEFLVGRDD